MASSRDRAASYAGIAAVGAVAGATIAYYLASHPRARRMAWQLLKVTVTSSLPAVLVNELQPQSQPEELSLAALPVAQD